MRCKVFLMMAGLVALEVASSIAGSFEAKTYRTAMDTVSSIDAGRDVDLDRAPRQHRVPESFAVSVNYPNPFNAITSIDLDLPSQAVVRIVIYNTLGQKVRTLDNESLVCGRYSLEWDGRNDAGDTVSSGLYFYVLVADDNYAIRKMMLLK